MPPGRLFAWIGLVAGVLLWLVTSRSVVVSLIVPRGRTSRITKLSSAMVRRSFGIVARHQRSYLDRDRLLAFEAPMSLVTILTVWILCYVAAYALILWPLAPAANFGAALRESASSLFTLGFASEPGAAPTAVMAAAAATGLVVVALQIAYLPTMYAAFSRRETAVTLLETRAGSPAWGPEILARHMRFRSLESVTELYAAWEVWTADVLESHLTYPVLVFFRSPHALSSWILGLLAVLDSAAMYDALAPERCPRDARLMLRMGYVALNELAEMFGLAHTFDADPDDPLQLSYDEFAAGCGRVLEAGFPAERGIEDAWIHFKGWRVNYEAAAYGIADMVHAAPGPWSGPRTRLPDQMIIPQRPSERSPRAQK